MRAFLAFVLTVFLGWSPVSAQPAPTRQATSAGAARARALVLRGDRFLAAGDRGTAIGYFREAVQADPSWGLSYLRLGEAYRARGSLADAREAFEAGLRRSPDDAELWLALAQTWEDLGRPDAATDALRQLLARQPGHRDALTRWAALAEARGVWTEALNATRRLLASAARDPGCTDEGRAEMRQHEAALRILSRPIDPLSAARNCVPSASTIRRRLARCR